MYVYVCILYIVLRLRSVKLAVYCLCAPWGSLHHRDESVRSGGLLLIAKPLASSMKAVDKKRVALYIYIYMCVCVCVFFYPSPLANLPISSKAHINTSGAMYGLVPDMLQASPSGGSRVAMLKSVRCACPVRRESKVNTGEISKTAAPQLCWFVAFAH